MDLSALAVPGLASSSLTHTQQHPHPHGLTFTQHALLQAQQQSPSQRPKKSRFRGVYKCGRKWKAQIQLKGRQYYLGLFDNEKDAAKAYDLKAREEKGSNAQCNFDEEGRESLAWAKRSGSDEMEADMMTPVQAGLSLQQLQALYLTGRMQGLGVHGESGMEGSADAQSSTAALRRRVEAINTKLKELQDTYTAYEKLPDGNEKIMKLQSSMKETMALLDEKSKLVDAIASSSQSPAATPNFSMLDIAHLQNTLLQAYAMQHQQQQQQQQQSSQQQMGMVQDHTTDPSMQHRQMDIEKTEVEVSVTVQGPHDEPDETSLTLDV